MMHYWNAAVRLSVSASCLLLASCAVFEDLEQRKTAPGIAAVTVSTEIAKGDATAEAGTDADVESAQPQILQVGTEISYIEPPPRPPVRLDGEAVSLDFEEAPLVEVVHAILGDILGLDYVIDHPIQGQITLRTRSPIPRDQLLSMLESLLQSNNAVMVRDPNDRFFVSSSPELRNLLPAYSSSRSEGAGFSNVIVPLQYIGAAEMASILRPVAGEDAFVRVDTLRNYLILAGSRNQIDGWMQIVSTFDIDQLQNMAVALIPLENRSVELVYSALEELLRGGSESAAGSAGASGADSATSGASITGVSMLGSLVRVVPMEGLDSLLVISPRNSYIQQVREWVERLDNPLDASGEPSLFVYPVQNGDAQQMAELLSGLLGGSGGGAGGGIVDNGVAPGMTPMSTGAGARSQGAANRNARGRGSSAFSLGTEVRVVADSFNNTLLIYAPQREYRKIEEALIQLDVVPKQVLIEASILEVQLVDGLQYGLEWAFNSSTGDYAGAGLLALGENAIGPRVPGFSYTLTDSADAVRAVVNALAEDSLVNVISTPSIMVLDNHTASIQVGDQQPIQSAQTVSQGGNLTTSVEFKDTGVQLEVTPTVNAGGLVTMDIKQSVTDVGPVDSATGQRSFLNRDVTSRVAIRSGESVVLGGLIRDNSTVANSGIPVLKDIPGLGALFGGTTRDSTRTELLVFITPRVMRNQQELRDISAEMRNRMKGISSFGDLPLAAQPKPAAPTSPD